MKSILDTEDNFTGLRMQCETIALLHLWQETHCLNIQLFDDTNNVTTDVVSYHGCPENCEILFEIYEGTVDIL